ncbi:MAG: bacterial transcriptional activator domain-containing protein [Planctomycetota bacterium]
MATSAVHREEVVGVLAGVLVALAVLPWVVTFAPEVVWDIDPRSTLDEMGRVLSVTAVGPVGAAWWSVGLVGWSAVVMAGALGCGVRVRWWAVGLWALGVAWAVPWMGGRMTETWLVGAWIGGASAGLAMAHAARLGAARRWAAAVLLGVSIPVMVDAAWYMAVEHPVTVAQYEATREETLASRGWAVGSAQAELYERRLRSPDVIGAIGFSNVMGTIAGALGVLALGLAASGWWRSRGRNEIDRRVGRSGVGGLVVLLLLTVGLAWLVWATRSKGALAATAAGAGWVALAWVVTLWASRRGALKPVRGVLVGAALLPVVGAVTAVFVRGAMGPPADWTGERSLLFRWHYWVGAWRAWVEQGVGGRWWGVGPSGFSTGYLRHKPTINPEEVTSAHAVWVDWPVMLGLGGAAWVALLLGMLALGAWRCVGSGDPVIASGEAVGWNWRVRAGVGVVIAALVMGSQLAYEAPMMWLDARLVWLVAAGGMIAVIAVMSGWGGERGWAWGLGWVGAAVVVVAQSQIEMGFFQPGGVAGLWCVVGVASAVGLREVSREAGPSVRFISGIALIGVVGGALAITLVARASVPIMFQHTMLVGAAELWRRGDIDHPRFVESLTQSAVHAPISERAWSWSSRIGQATGDDEWLETLIARGGDLHRPTSVQRTRAALARLRDDLPAEIDAWRAAIDAAPGQLTYRLQLAQSLDRSGRSDEATEAYRAALELNDRLYLDPAKQLPADQVEAIRQRVDRLTP